MFVIRIHQAITLRGRTWPDSTSDDEPCPARIWSFESCRTQERETHRVDNPLNLLHRNASFREPAGEKPRRESGQSSDHEPILFDANTESIERMKMPEDQPPPPRISGHATISPSLLVRVGVTFYGFLHQTQWQGFKLRGLSMVLANLLLGFNLAHWQYSFDFLYEKYFEIFDFRMNVFIFFSEIALSARSFRCHYVTTIMYCYVLFCKR